MASTIYNAANGGKLDLRQLLLPRYAKNWLSYLLVERNMAQRTIADYAVSAQTFLRWVKSLETHTPVDEWRTMDVSDVPLATLAGFRREDIYDFLTFCASELDNSAASRAAKLSAVRSLYDYLKDKETGAEIAENPAAEISSPKLEKRLPVYLSLDEARSLLGAVSGEAEDRDRCIILWLLTCGMRLSELVGIDLDDIKDNSVRLYGKGRKERIIYLNQPCMDALDAYLMRRKSYRDADKERALFTSGRTGQRLTGRRVQQLVEKALANAGLQGKGYSPHKLRHTAATVMYQNGCAELLEIKEILGHASVGTTQIYCHTADRALRSALDGLGNLLSEKGGEECDTH